MDAGLDDAKPGSVVTATSLSLWLLFLFRASAAATRETASTAMASLGAAIDGIIWVCGFFASSEFVFVVAAGAVGLAATAVLSLPIVVVREAAATAGSESRKVPSECWDDDMSSSLPLLLSIVFVLFLWGAPVITKAGGFRNAVVKVLAAAAVPAASWVVVVGTVSSVVPSMVVRLMVGTSILLFGNNNWVVPSSKETLGGAGAAGAVVVWLLTPLVCIITGGDRCVVAAAVLWSILWVLRRRHGSSRDQRTVGTARSIVVVGC